MQDITPSYKLIALKDKVVLPDPTEFLTGQSLSGGQNFNATGTQTGTGNTVIMSDPSYGFWIGAADFANAPFKVNMQGNATATSLTTTHLDIPDTTTANSFHVDTSGNTWWGATTLGASVASITKAGLGTFSNITITGGSISSTPISSIPNNASTDISLLGFSHNLVFTSVSATQINWGTGTIILSNGRTFSISAGNTGAMAAATYIYLDTGVSSTVLQTTTTYSIAQGANKILIATAQNNATAASVIPFGGGQPVLDGAANIAALSITAASIAANTITGGKIAATTITASNIVAGTITGTQIAAKTITSGLINVSQLSAISADMGTITAGTITLASTGYINSGQTDYNTGTGFFLGRSGAATKFSIGNPATYYLTWDGSTLTVKGTVPDVQIFTSNGTWTKPAGAQFVRVVCIGAGGGGAGADHTLAERGGSGGGGGVWTEKIFLASDLTSTVSVTIGLGGAGGSLSNGSAGGNSSFGSYLSAYGGGGGFKATTGTTTSGGGGGGGAAVGQVGQSNADSLGGVPVSTPGANGISTGGGGGVNGGDGKAGEYGGGAGGGAVAAVSGVGKNGGDSLYGAGGGGGGGSHNTPDRAGGAGGGIQTYSSGGGGAGGAPGVNGTNGTNGAIGTGGGGGGGKTGTGGNGGNGGVPGGGGGGGGSGSITDGIGGAGGRGEVRIYTS